MERMEILSYPADYNSQPEDVHTSPPWLLIFCMGSVSVFTDLVRPSARDLHVRQSTSIYHQTWPDFNHFITTPHHIK